MIKVALFDLDGVVIVGRDKLFSQRAAEDLNISNDQIMEFFNKDFRECSFGRADLKEKISPYLKIWNYKGTVDDFLNYWFSGEGVVDMEVINCVARLREKGIRCFIATRQEKYRKKYLLEEVGLQKYFDGIMCTCDIGFDKWETGYWDYVFKKLNVSPEEIIFFCDSQKNIDNSGKIGVQAYLYTDISVLKDKMASLV